MNQLPNAPGYVWKDKHLGTRFHARGVYVNLDKITDDGVAALLAADEAYWGEKFAPKPKKKPAPVQAETTE